MRIGFSMAAIFGAALVMGTSHLALAHEPQAQGSTGPGPGMMGSPPDQPNWRQDMMGPNRIGPGQMGWGQMGPGMMGPHMMGQGMGYGMMGPGQMGWGQMGPGMMGPHMMGQGMGYGMMGYGMGDWSQMRQQRLPRDLSAKDVEHMMEHRLAWGGNPNLKLGKVEEKDADTIVAEIVTQDGSLVRRFQINRHTGQMQPAG